MKLEEIIVSILREDETITSVAGSRIYPLRGAQSRTMPFLTFSGRVEPNSNKMEKSLFDTYFVDIIIFSDSYQSLITLTDAVRSLFEAVEYSNENIYVSFDFLTYREDYDNNGNVYNKTVSIIAQYYVN